MPAKSAAPKEMLTQVKICIGGMKEKMTKMPARKYDPFEVIDKIVDSLNEDEVDTLLEFYELPKEITAEEIENKAEEMKIELPTIEEYYGREVLRIVLESGIGIFDYDMLLTNIVYELEATEEFVIAGGDEE